jgi:condensin complex subunit 1
MDKTLRIEMDNSIFRKLQDMVEQPCRSKEWFVLAEQAINTVYALGEHPDALCNDLVRNLTVRAFGAAPKVREDVPPPAAAEAMEVDDAGVAQEKGEAPVSLPNTHGTLSTAPSSNQTDDRGERDLGDAFELSQLLFVVGHVAIKQIVFLELVEREWKRQKDGKQTGALL